MRRNKKLFAESLTSWRNSVTRSEEIDWTEQLRILNDVADLITPDLTIEQIIAGKAMPSFTFDATAPNRLASWCIRNEAEIFMNDFDKEYSKYLHAKPIPITGSDPNAAIYVPLKLNKELVGLITVRYPQECLSATSPAYPENGRQLYCESPGAG